MPNDEKARALMRSPYRTRKLLSGGGDKNAIAKRRAELIAMGWRDRRCLRCDVVFLSSGNGNRLCPDCHKATEGEHNEEGSIGRLASTYDPLTFARVNMLATGPYCKRNWGG